MREKMRETMTVIVDPAKCTGCDLCRLACSFAREGSFHPRASRVGVAGEDRAGFSPLLCRNCEKPPCLDACPSGAIVRNGADGRVVLVQEKCRGCNMCVMVCPFNAIRAGGRTAFKCNGCEDAPRCAAACPLGALRFADLDRESRRRRRAFARSLPVADGL